jgi:hypothetical protein
MLKKLFLLVFLLCLSSCSIFFEKMPKSWNWGFKPRPISGIKNFPSADTEYGKGFRDGCSSAWDAAAKGLMSDLKGQYDYKRMLKSSDYNTGWWDGYEQCTYILDWDVA